MTNEELIQENKQMKKTVIMSHDSNQIKILL